MTAWWQTFHFRVQGSSFRKQTAARVPSLSPRAAPVHPVHLTFTGADPDTHMADTDVIKLPEERVPAKKRSRAQPQSDPEEEARSRRRNAQRLAGLGASDSSVKLLEELVFGAEDELLEKLVQVNKHVIM